MIRQEAFFICTCVCALGLAEIGYLPLVLSLITNWKKKKRRQRHPTWALSTATPKMQEACFSFPSSSTPLSLSYAHQSPYIYIHLFILLFIIILFYLYLYCFNSTPTCLFNCFLLFSMLNKLGVLRLGILLSLILLLIYHNCWTAPGISRSIIESNKIIRKLTTLI